MFHKFTFPVPGTLRGFLDNDTTTRDKISLKVLGVKKGKSGGVAMMMKTGMRLVQYYIFFFYGPPIPQNNLSSQDIAIVSGIGVNLETTFFSPR